MCKYASDTHHILVPTCTYTSECVIYIRISQSCVVSSEVSPQQTDTAEAAATSSLGDSADVQSDVRRIDITRDTTLCNTHTLSTAAARPRAGTFLNPFSEL